MIKYAEQALKLANELFYEPSASQLSHITLLLNVTNGDIETTKSIMTDIVFAEKLRIEELRKLYEKPKKKSFWAWFK